MSAPQAICPDIYLAGVTYKTYNMSVGRAYIQERLGLEDDRRGCDLIKGIIMLSELFIL